MLAKILSQRHGFRCTVLFPLNPDGTINPDLSAKLSNPEMIAKADGLIFQLRFRAYPDDVMKMIDGAVNKGIPILGLRTSTHAFRFPANATTSYRHYNNFGRDVLGENWVSHWGANRKGATRGVVEPGSERHPVLRGVENVFADSGVYETHPVKDAQILMRGVVLKGMKPDDAPADYKKQRASDKMEQGINDPAMPVAWVREHTTKTGAKAKVYCTTMGAATDFESEGLRRMVVNAVYWTFGMEVPERANVVPVDEYKPSPYSFKGYRKGITPSDHALGKVLPKGN
jgi:hypothetical protein